MRYGSGTVKGGPFQLTSWGIIVALLATIAILLARPSANPPPPQEQAAPSAPPARIAGWTARRGLPNAAAKLAAGGSFTIAIIGGPTAASGGERGYPWLVSRSLAGYRDAHVKLINAGLVDGGSRLGAARLERDVLVHRPDLLLIDFAADDSSAEDARHVERLIRKAWTSDPKLDIMLIYGVSVPQLSYYRSGQFPPAAAAHERLADHYGVPSVALGADVAQAFDTDSHKLRPLFIDEIRLTPAGHALYGERIIAALHAMLAPAHALPEPIYPDLALHPPIHSAEPRPEPPPMVHKGRTARTTYEMPLVGRHWVQEPEFKIDGNVVWRLSSLSALQHGRRLHDGFATDRNARGEPLKWFDEAGYFCGPSGVYLAYGSDQYNGLAAREDDLPIVHFIAPQAGRYVVRMSAGEVVLFGFHTALAVNVIHFSAGSDSGRSIAYHQTRAPFAEPPDIEREITLAEGDEIAVALDTNALSGGGGAVYRDVMLNIGYFGHDR
jgi:lysophospholipase L1-like esterase